MMQLYLKVYNGKQTKGASLELFYQTVYAPTASPPQLSYLTFNGILICSNGNVVPPSPGKFYRCTRVVNLQTYFEPFFCLVFFNSIFLRNSKFFGMAASCQSFLEMLLSRDVEYFSYHRMVSLDVNMPISYFSFCQ